MIDQCNQQLVQDGWAQTEQQEENRLGAMLLAKEDILPVATHRCLLVVDRVALVVPRRYSSLLQMSFHFTESDICRLVYFGDAVLFYFILSIV